MIYTLKRLTRWFFRSLFTLGHVTKFVYKSNDKNYTRRFMPWKGLQGDFWRNLWTLLCETTLFVRNNTLCTKQIQVFRGRAAMLLALKNQDWIYLKVMSTFWGAKNPQKGAKINFHEFWSSRNIFVPLWARKLKKCVKNLAPKLKKSTFWGLKFV